MTAAGALAGRHALVTGAGRGIGQAIAEALAREGARISLLGRDRDRLAAVQRELGPMASVVCADVTDRAAVGYAFAEARAQFGELDILVNNAGQAASAPVAKTDDALFWRMIDVNVRGVHNCIQEALPSMLERRHGRIVNIASTAGLTGYAYCSAYCAAKHAVIGLTRAIAVEVAAKGVTVNAVCPGFTDTDLVRDAIMNIQQKTGRSSSEAQAMLVAGNLQQRLVSPEEVADAVRWLCGAGAASVTGQSIAVAGGEVM